MDLEIQDFYRALDLANPGEREVEILEFKEDLSPINVGYLLEEFKNL